MQENMKSGKLRQEGTKGEEKVGSFAEEKTSRKADKGDEGRVEDAWRVKGRGH